MRLLLLLACLFSMPAAALAQITDSGDATFQPVTPAESLRRLDEAASEYAAQYPPGTTSHRYVQIDAAWPSDAIEYAAMGHHAILLVTAVSQKAEELPLARVLIRTDDGQEIVLKQIMSFRSQMPDGNPSTGFFGPHRQDAFFLLPIDAYTRPGALLTDFAVNRTHFRIGDTFPEAPDWWEYPRVAPVNADEATILAVVDREYPGYRLSQ